MKLSEAMRQGATLHPQAYKMLRSASGATCALGAACEGAGIEMAQWYKDGTKLWPELERTVTMPNGSYSRKLIYAIAELNDVERWTREDIANWLATHGW